MKKILVTGNLGYIGSVLTPILVKKGYHVLGLDCGFFKDCITNKKKKINKQIIKDIRDVTERDLNNVDCIVHLAALSNDPLGEFDQKVTFDINYLATLKLAKLAKKKSVKKFIFISTQSIYGISETIKELKETDLKNPITAYAKSKWMAEKKLKNIFNKNFHGIVLRPATVFGPSPRFRSDIVLNNFVGWAYNEGVINIMSDGSPFRPLLYVNDLCKIITEIIEKDLKKISGQAFNIGISKANYTVLDLAKKVKKFGKNIKIIVNNLAEKDQRTYKVSFIKMKKHFSTKMKKTFIDRGIKELFLFYKKNNINKTKFLGPYTVRLKMLKKLRKLNKIDKNLKFIN
jgi:nucleoside-diphosphate-sugar epimerase